MNISYRCTKEGGAKKCVIPLNHLSLPIFYTTTEHAPFATVDPLDSANKTFWSN